MNKTQTELKAAKRNAVDTGNIPRSRTKRKEPAKASLADEVAQLFERHKADMPLLPSWKRVAAATFVTLALSSAAGYGIGTIAMYAMVGVMTLTGSALVSYLVFTLSMLLAFYIGMKIGQHVGSYILSGQIDHDISNAKDKVLGFFKRSDNVVAAAA